jgi:RNA polymerase sigma-54 factor
MKQSLQLRLKQQLTLTPQLQQAIRLLQLSTLELNQEIEQALQENPLLEREDIEEHAAEPTETASEPSSESGHEQEAEPLGRDDGLIDQGDIWGEEYAPSRHKEPDEEGEFGHIAAPEPSLYEHLASQLRMLNLSERDRALILWVIESLDEDGFLADSLETLLAELPPELEVEIDELSIALRHVQAFDPIGVGARDLRESLLLQLALHDDAAVPLAQQIVRECLELFAAKDYNKIRKALGCTDDELRAAYQLISRLDPRPGSRFGHTDVRYVAPDVVVKKTRGVWQASLNPQVMPRLRVNDLYAGILQHNREGGGNLGGQLQEARWLIKNVQQRFETILRVSQAIVERQQRFFEYGAVAMKPLILRDIADELGLHESTISRVTTQKYMLTPMGVFELKYFFGSHVETETGGECSAIAIRALIKQLIAAEDSKKPLSDSQLSEMLGQQGIVVARRTVAKYREALQIPPVNQRKSI